MCGALVMVGWSVAKALREGLDIKTIASAALFGLTVLWGASQQWNKFNDHLASIDTKVSSQAESTEKAMTLLDGRIASLEIYRSQEEKRAAQDEKEMATLNEQIKGMREDVTDLKGMMQTLILHEMRIDKESSHP